MNINFDNFLKWAEDRFDGDVIVRGNEIRINSIFTEDQKYHLWCNPFGGKYNREDGCYRCFYTDKKGTLVGLVMLVDNCSYREAKDTLSDGIKLVDLEEELNKFFIEKDVVYNNSESKIKLPEHSIFIDSMSSNNFYKIDVVDYLNKRKIKPEGLLYCTEGEYNNRIIIPYYDRDYNLIYYNSRHIGKSKLRYMGPPKSIGVGKGDVLFVPQWPKKGEKLYLTEGEFDALALFNSGLYSAACGGKFLTEKQIIMLNEYKVCLSLDQDNAGFKGLIEMGKQLISHGITVSFVRPPKGYKDWNDVLIKLDKNILITWIQTYEKSFSPLTSDALVLDRL